MRPLLILIAVLLFLNLAIGYEPQPDPLLDVEQARAVVAQADRERQQRADACMKELAPILKKYGCVISVDARPVILASPEPPSPKLAPPLPEPED